MLRKRQAPAAGRNAGPIREVLADLLPAGLVLEVASGTGQHAAHMAAAFPHVTWQPSDADPVALTSIAAWVAESSLANLRAPIELDVEVEPWPLSSADAIVCINLLHIAPWSAALALFRGAARLLGPGGLLYTYGPYRFDGQFTSPSNAAFDASLRLQDAAWGVRDLRDLEAAARAAGLRLADTIRMPANNHSLVFRREESSP
jgi:SAM-dependent methyltransferase